ncbi:glycosyltransferase family 2 protein [Parabacteroides sp.]
MEKNEAINGLISVIIPVYNTENYLEGTINSILNQDYSDWELLLVDDGSTDMSAEICDRYALVDNRISVFHIQNSGVSHARNVGIGWSRGEYIVFCDSDDLISPVFLSMLKIQLESTNADIVRCAMKPIGEKTHAFEEGNCTFEWKIYEAEEFVSIPESMYYVVWGKMYRKSLIVDNNIIFDEYLNRGEDSLFAYETMLCSSRIVYSDSEYVNYRIRGGSLMRSNVSISLYEQSVRKYYMLCEFVSRQSLNKFLWEHIRKSALLAITDNLIKSVEDEIVFKSNFRKFCTDEILQQSLGEVMGGFPKRLRLAVSMMLLLKNVKATSFVRLLLKNI